MTTELNTNGFSDLDQLKQTVKKQGEIIQQQGEQIELLTEELHQLVFVLYNQKKQVGQLDFSQRTQYDPDYYTIGSKGDYLERRIDELEAKLAQFGELFPKNHETNDKLSECLQERKKSSASLCGNE